MANIYFFNHRNIKNWFNFVTTYANNDECNAINVFP